MTTNKSFSSETSERYSRVLFEVSKEARESEKAESDLKNFLSIYDNTIELQNFLQNPTKNLSTQKQVVNLLSDKLDFSKNLRNFFLLLIDKRRLFFVKKIIETFMKLCSKKRGEIKASLTTSKQLSESELQHISKELSSSIGSTVKFDYKVDEDLIGGLKLQLGSFMIDTSIKNKLKKYKQLMLEN